MNPPLEISPEAADALAENRPVVALESTIITHGMPYPDNLETARTVERELRAAGAAPATIAVIEGRIRVGLDDGALDRLAQTPDARKLSRADLAICLAEGATGATTVSATMILARLAGIEVFATGGVGGVHRGAAESYDISADLHELARTPLSVVSAGAKAILDLPKTLEVLETLGVPVITVGQNEFPAFWSRRSGLASPERLDHPGDIARAHRMRAALGLHGGQLIANPVPEDAEIPLAEIAPMIEQAIAEAKQAAIIGKAVTPYLLGRIFELSEGRSLYANVALVRNNARLAAAIAAELTLIAR